MASTMIPTAMSMCSTSAITDGAAIAARRLLKERSALVMASSAEPPGAVASSSTCPSKAADVEA